MTRLLVTGGAGFVGANFVHHVLAHTTCDVTVLDKLTYAGNRASLDGLPASRLEFVHGDVCDATVVDDLVAGADAVVHFAAESHNDNSLRDPEPFVATNVTGTAVLLEAVRRHGVRLHHVSTDEVFGDLALEDPTRFTESSAYNPSSPYSATKAGSDLLVRAWVRSFGIEATISTSSNIYGPFQHVEKFIPRSITNVLRGTPPRLYGQGRNLRDWVHVEDHSAAVLAVLERGRIGATYLLGTEREHSNLEVLRLVLRLMGRPADAFEHVADRPGHDRRYALDTSRIRGELGWAPRFEDLADGLAATIDWYRGHEEWWAPAKHDTEARYAQGGQ